MDKFFTANSPLACGVFRLRIMTRLSASNRVPDHRLHGCPRRSPARQRCKRGAQDQAIGRSRGRLSTKIHLAVRGLGCPAGFVLTAGQKGDAPQASALLEAAVAEFVIADAAFDADHSEKLRPKKAPKPSSLTTPRLRSNIRSALVGLGDPPSLGASSMIGLPHLQKTRGEALSIAKSAVRRC